MSGHAAAAPGFWRVVWLLLVAARRRSTGRYRRQMQLMQQRSGRKGRDWGVQGFFLGILLMAGLNISAAIAVKIAVTAAERSVAQRNGWTVVDPGFIAQVERAENDAASTDWNRPDHPSPGQAAGTELQTRVDRALYRAFRNEAHRIAQLYGGNQADIVWQLRNAVWRQGTSALMATAEAAPGLTWLPQGGPLPAMFGSLVLLIWFVMLVFQGEGPDLDTQRRRHPMWEFLFSHPVPPGAVFLAEMLSPIAANPVFFSAPLLAGVLYGLTYGAGFGALAILLAGVPITLAAACLGKALEVCVLLRFSARSRGAVMGLMGWLGYVTMVLLFLAALKVGIVVTALAPLLRPLTALPWPWLGLFLGETPSGFSFPLGVATCCILSAAVIAGSVRVSVWGAQLGVSGQADRGAAPATVTRPGAGFGRNALYRKEFLWLVRDRGAIVQAFLIPLTMAGFQMFNMRGLVANAAAAWNVLCGAAIMFGIYFLSVLGPKSLASEGTALWLPLTWPLGLEGLLKAKAWLWSLISTAVVGAVLLFAAVKFPSDIWKIALVFAGWFLFARSMAEKAVTLASVTSESGEIQKVPYGRRMATQLGTFTFAIGVLTQQWSVAVMGIVYSIMTSAAMWQNFRARLPYLFDQWSEVLPPPPTLMHAMIAISVLVELGTLFAAIPMAFAGPGTVAVARAASYGLWAVIVAAATTRFLARRGVRLTDIVHWPGAGADRAGWQRFAAPGRAGLAAALLLGAALGGVLGLGGQAYLAALHLIPRAAHLIDTTRAHLDSVPHARLGLFIMAVVVAPFAEEFLFRGLLFRALDREWGGWRAVLGSAAFFAIYHPPLAWPAVGTLGAINCIVFKRTGRLAPAIALHMAYNAVVLG